MKYAILNSGGKQYVAREGETIEVDRLPLEIGKPVEFNEILLVADNGDVAVGAPVVKGATVKGRVLDQIKAAKIIVFKYVPKQRYRRKQGHRQRYTRVAIEKISLSAAGEKKVAAKDTPKKAAVEEKAKTSTAKATQTTASKAKAATKEKPKSAPKPAAKKTTASKTAPKKTAASAGTKKASSTKASTAKKSTTKGTKAASKKTESKSSTKSSSEKSTKDKKKE